MYAVYVMGPGGMVPAFAESFDAPDWQTALLAAAEVVKVDPAFIEPRSGSCPDCHMPKMGDIHSQCPNGDERGAYHEPESACDIPPDGYYACYGTDCDLC